MKRYSTTRFSAFGRIIETPKIMRDVETELPRGFGFVSFNSFKASDLAIECLNGQYLCDKQIVVQYAFKKDAPGERHGSQAERLLAASRDEEADDAAPHHLFADAPSTEMLEAPPPPPPGLMLGMTPPPPPHPGM